MRFPRITALLQGEKLRWWKTIFFFQQFIASSQQTENRCREELLMDEWLGKESNVWLSTDKSIFDSISPGINILSLLLLFSSVVLPLLIMTAVTNSVVNETASE
ncbi:hypothetical protein CDAR_574751 [Caerostris darwini]|uniref:Uncharacterized protein n=1 Tax=Caerostris darwini TaxID=1538125 RepID=A0AAV4T1H4_9ARAC|nr:hypothetical protein CDAR_574751 [Caerostris darwini]